jgi:metal-responsive CopG/Arc/MetJ family transcriptional regulator
MTTQARLPENVYEAAEEVRDEYDYPSVGEAIRHMVREGGYDV